MSSLSASALATPPLSAPPGLVMGVAPPSPPTGVVAVVNPVVEQGAKARTLLGRSELDDKGGRSFPDRDECARRIQALVRRKAARRVARRLKAEARMKAIMEQQQVANQLLIGKSSKTKRNGSGLRRCPRTKADGPCGVLSGPRAKKCKGCGTPFILSKQAEKKRMQRKRRAEKKGDQSAQNGRNAQNKYDKAPLKKKLKYLEQHFLKTCVFCTEVAGFADEEGFVYLCNDCKVPACVQCARKFAEVQLVGTEEEPGCFGFYSEEPEYFDARKYGKWCCPGCRDYKSFPVFQGDKVGKPSLNVQCFHTDSENQFHFVDEEARNLSWRPPKNNPSRWDIEHYEALIQRRSVIRLNKIREEEKKIMWKKLVRLGAIQLLQECSEEINMNLFYDAHCPEHNMPFFHVLRRFYRRFIEVVSRRPEERTSLVSPPDATPAGSEELSRDVVLRLSLLTQEDEWKNRLGLQMQESENQGPLRVTGVLHGSPASKTLPVPMEPGMVIEGVRTPVCEDGLWNYEMQGTPYDIESFISNIKRAARASLGSRDENPIQSLIITVKCPIVV